MSKIFKAFEEAEKEKALSLLKKGIDLPQIETTDEDVLQGLLHPTKEKGEIRSSTDGMSPLLIAYSDPHSMVAEQIKRIRTYILYNTMNNSLPRTIMVTSSISAEGKSFIAANLAVSIAQGLHEHVLLVDSDLRNPVMNTFFNQPQCFGLSDYLNEETGLSEIIRPTGIKKLSLISGGREKRNPVELLSSNRMKEMVREVRERYDDRYIIFDSTPVLLTNEPTVLSKIIDGIIYVVRHNFTSREIIKKALGYFSKDKVICLVFNDFAPEFTGYYGYSYRKYYGKYEKKENKGKKIK